MVEHGRRRRLGGDDPAQLFGQIRLDVLPGLLLVLRVLCPTTNVGLVASQEKVGFRERR
jgi:hypothetical protein